VPARLAARFCFSGAGGEGDFPIVCRARAEHGICAAADIRREKEVAVVHKPASFDKVPSTPARLGPGSASRALSKLRQECRATGDRRQATFRRRGYRTATPGYPASKQRHLASTANSVPNENHVERRAGSEIFAVRMAELSSRGNIESEREGFEGTGRARPEVALAAGAVRRYGAPRPGRIFRMCWAA
ncbi:Hypothetical predicted protein, partial [Olea europaea subsp. europaea]